MGVCSEENSLERFLDAQKRYYPIALEEIRTGRKESHWMWFIFPQIIGLGYSPTACYYAIRNLEEAKEYLAHRTLRSHLLEISLALLSLSSDDPKYVLGYPDDLKLQSSMTLFEIAGPEHEVFSKVLDKFYHGKRDPRTIEILKEQESGTN